MPWGQSHEEPQAVTLCQVLTPLVARGGSGRGSGRSTRRPSYRAGTEPCAARLTAGSPEPWPASAGTHQPLSGQNDPRSLAAWGTRDSCGDCDVLGAPDTRSSGPCVPSSPTARPPAHTTPHTCPRGGHAHTRVDVLQGHAGTEPLKTHACTCRHTDTQVHAQHVTVPQAPVHQPVSPLWAASS